MTNREYAKAKDLVTFKTGKLDSNAAEDRGKYPFFTCAQTTYSINSYAFDTECVLLAGNNAAGVFPLKYYSGKFNAYQRTYVIEPINRSRLDIKYFYFYLRPLLKAFEQQATGVTTKFLTLKILNNLDVALPSIGIQKKIAAILSAYDDLIENNKRRIALLEKMAEEIYCEWFVRMRFPGHEKVRFEKGVPEGWNVRPFSEVVEVNPVERIDKDKEKPFVSMEDLSLTSMFFMQKEVRTGSSGSKFRNNDVLLPRITPSLENGKRGFVMTLDNDQVGFGSTEFIVLRQKILGPEHIYFLTCSPDFRKHAELSMAGASGRQRVQENCFTFFLVKTPPPDLRIQFSELVNPCLSEIRLLSKQINNLSASRNLLLSRLISGKLSVENLDVQFPPSMLDDEYPAHESPVAAIAATG